MVTAIKTMKDALEICSVEDWTPSLVDAMDLWAMTQAARWAAWCKGHRKDPTDTFHWDAFLESQENPDHQ